MDKSLLFKMKIDTSDFERTVKEIQNKVSKIYGSSDVIKAQNQTADRMNNNGIATKSPGQEAFKKATENHHRDLNTLIQTEKKAQEDLIKLMGKKNDQLKILAINQSAAISGSAEELKIRQQILAVEENQSRLQKDYLAKNTALNQLLDQKEKQTSVLDKVREGYQTGGIMGGMKSAGQAAAGASGQISTIIGAVVAAARAGSDVYKYLGQAPIATSSANGSAMQATAGRELSSVYGNRQAYEMAFMPEKSRAAAMAMESTKRVEQTQMFDAVSDVGGSALKYGAMGAAGGAAAGLAGGIFAPITSTAGALVGGLGGAAYGAYKGMSGDNTSTLMSPFSETANADRQAKLAQDFAQNFSKALEGEQNKNPLKKLAAEEYQANFSANLSAQRGMGLDYQSFHGKGGFQDQITSAGFTNQMGLEMQGSILGAGGSSRSASENSAMGLQMQRGMNLTNASSVLGTLSGGLGSSESTRNATVKILAEGMKLGLDDSKFAEENRRFTQAAAEVVTRSGASSDKDFERISQGFSKFMAENTNQGINAGKTAYDQYQGMTKETSGARGTMRASGILSDPDLGKLSTLSKQALMSVQEEELNTDNPIVMNAAKEADLSPEDVVSKVKDVNKNSVSRFKDYDTTRDRLQGRMKELGITQINPKDQNLPEDVRDDYNRLATMNAVENGYSNQRTLEASTTGLTALEGNGLQKAREDAVTSKLSDTQTGKIEDETVRGMAESSKLVNDNFRNFKDTLVPTAEAIAKFNENLKATIDILSKLPDAQRGEAFRKINAGLYGAPASPGNQSQAGKSSQ